ncbi:MAG: EamA family transporter [Lachnospiraceae bacterium]|jgi:undecaprenyl phosphate-alpha-L-ara4N flippase subunit ArnE|nr:EamA family transporter [Lachnospiraceae bacterium]
MLESLKRNGKGIILMLISALSLSVGQLLWKLADVSDLVAPLLAGDISFAGIWKVFLAVLPGFVVYAVGALIMTIALGYGELSVLQPVNSMSYVFALILSAIFLTERISWLTIIGIFVIIAGVIMIGGSDK